MSPRALSFGSLNIDHVYRVARFARPGETLAVRDYARHPGGKGANQAVALASAGAPTFLAGKVGEDGRWLLEFLRSRGVDTRFVEVGEAPTGHAVIQVEDGGQNSILIHPGANETQDEAQVRTVLAGFGSGDWLVVQHETNALDCMVETAVARGMTVVLNPSPTRPAAESCDLGLVDYLVLNEEEGAALAGASSPEAIVETLRARHRMGVFVLTLGERGVLCGSAHGVARRAAEPTEAVDTTGAGDAFLGYFVAARMSGAPIAEALDQATRAAALCVSRPGGMDSIPRRAELRPAPGAAQA